MVPSGKLKVCYWKLPCIVDLPINSMVDLSSSQTVNVYQRLTEKDEVELDWSEMFSSLTANVANNHMESLPTEVPNPFAHFTLW